MRAWKEMSAVAASLNETAPPTPLSPEAWFDDDYFAEASVPASHVIASKITSSMSILGSYVLLREVFQERQSHHRSKVVNNLLISLSVADLFSSTSFFMGTWLVGSNADGDIWGAWGNVQTCEVQGFFFFLGYLTSPLFNCALATTYLLLVGYKMRGCQLVPYQVYTHSGIWLLTLTLTTIPIPLDWYNSVGNYCSVYYYPDHCVGFEETDDDIWAAYYCERGGWASYLYGIILDVLVPSGSILYCSVTMVLIWRSVRTTEERSSRYNSSWQQTSRYSSSRQSSSRPQDQGGEFRLSQEENEEERRTITDRTKSTEMMKQGMFFVLAFFLTYVPYMINWMIVSSESTFSQVVYFISTIICLPLQGFWNCLVFVRTRKMQTREGKLFRSIFFYFCEEKLVTRSQRPTFLTSGRGSDRTAGSHRSTGSNRLVATNNQQEDNQGQKAIAEANCNQACADDEESIHSFYDKSLDENDLPIESDNEENSNSSFPCKTVLEKGEAEGGTPSLGPSATNSHQDSLNTDEAEGSSQSLGPSATNSHQDSVKTDMDQTSTSQAAVASSGVPDD